MCYIVPMYKTFYKLKEQSICQHQKEQILGARLKLIFESIRCGLNDKSTQDVLFGPVLSI